MSHRRPLCSSVAARRAGAFVALLSWMLVGGPRAMAQDAASPAPAPAPAPTPTPTPAVAAAPGSVADLLARVAPAVVHVRFVLRAGDREQPSTTVATAIDPSGLLVADNAALGTGRVRAFDLKVTVAGETTEHNAVVVVRDSVLNVAWLHVVGREGTLPAVDLGVGDDPTLGQDLRSVSRTARGFDFAATVSRHYVASRVEKPRVMWALGGDALGAGRPVFDAKGRVVGVSAQQSGVAADDDGDGGGGNFVLPLAAVRRSLESARKLVPEALERAKTQAAEAPAAAPDAVEPEKETPAPDDDAPKEAPEKDEGTVPEQPK